MTTFLKSSFLLVCLSVSSLAQEPNRAPDDLAFSSSMPHIVASVELRVSRDGYLHYQYDRYPDKQRIQFEKGATYARKRGEAWRKSEDWGETGTSIDQDLSGQLQNFADIIESNFAAPVSRDGSQGKMVWKFISQSAESDYTSYTYELAREHPRPDGVYPRYTFTKYPKDADGELLLQDVTGQLRTDSGDIPFEIRLDYLIPAPTDVTVEPAPKPGQTPPVHL